MFEGSARQIAMHPLVRKPNLSSEFMTPERCRILEVWNDPNDPSVSIARARVAAGISTQLHRLRDVDERYVVVEGSGIVQVGDLSKETVGPGDIVVIPAGTSQQITNVGHSDLVFLCICSPRFSPNCYEALE